ncbi:hypothetical protein [Heyndrickxia camelliae]|nr:hypothetical protein [Heyndrickxia camelliae]
MNTYKIIDLQTDKVIAVNQTEEDLKVFANDLYWQDETSFENSTYEEVYKAILGCDYDVETESR